MSALFAPIAREDVVRWLHNLVELLDKNLHGDEREQILGDLRRDADSMRGTLPTLASLALIADCLHVVQMSILADGISEDSELARVRTLRHHAKPGQRLRKSRRASQQYRESNNLHDFSPQNGLFLRKDPLMQSKTA